MQAARYYVRSRGRVHGPLGRTELQRMYRRGLIGRMDEISLDQAHWIPLTELEDAESSAQEPGSAAKPTEAGPVVGPVRKYYYAQDGATVGPVPLQLLLVLASQGKLRPESMVWAAGSAQAVPASAMSELLGIVSRSEEAMEAGALGEADVPRRQQRLAPLLGAVAFAVATGISILLWHGLKSSPTATSVIEPRRPPHETTLPSLAEPPIGSLVADPITNASDELRIRGAIALVAVGFRRGEGDQSDERVLSQGTGFTVSPRGYVLTNKHVVARAQEPPSSRGWLRGPRNLVEPRIWVFFGRREAKYTARIEYVSASKDLAVLKIDRGQPNFFRLCGSRPPPRNTMVYAIGFPGIAMQPFSDTDIRDEIRQRIRSGNRTAADRFRDQDFLFTATQGAIGRTYSDGDRCVWIQHEAVLRHGNSGGPLITADGLVIGINTLMQLGEVDANTNLSLEMSQLRAELEPKLPGAIWE